MKIYVTFGQTHAHSVNGKTFDKDCVASIECESHPDGRDKTFAYFGPEFMTTYEQMPDMSYYHRGIIPVETTRSVGRPRTLIKPQRLQILLEPSDLAKANQLGNGNVSAGIRKALAQTEPG